MLPVALTLSLAVVSLPSLAPRHIDRLLSALSMVGVGACVGAWFVLALCVSSFAAVCLLIVGAVVVVFADVGTVGAYGRHGEPDAVLAPESKPAHDRAIRALGESDVVDCVAVVRGTIVKAVGPDPVVLAEHDAKIARADASRHRARAERYRAARAAYVASCVVVGGDV